MTDRQTDRRTDGQVFRSFRLVDTAAYNRADKTQPQAIWARWPVHTHSVPHSATQNTPELICRRLIFVSAMAASPRACATFLSSPRLFFCGLSRLVKATHRNCRPHDHAHWSCGRLSGDGNWEHPKAQGRGTEGEINGTIKLKEAMRTPSPQLLSTPLHVSLMDVGVAKGSAALQGGGGKCTPGFEYEANLLSLRA